jgi:hypothetical protein
MRNFLLASAAAAVLALSAGAADATQIIAFGQTSGVNTITGTNTGGTSTTISGDLSVSITQLLGASLPPDLAATLILNATSAGNATAGSPFDSQNFTGTFSIKNGATNYLSGSFTDAAFGAGPSLTISVGSAAGESVIFTSSVIPTSELGAPMGLSFSFSNVTPPVGITGTSLSSFTASVTGTASASAVPEPAGIGLLGVGLLGLGLTQIARKRS